MWRFWCSIVFGSGKQFPWCLAMCAHRFVVFPEYFTLVSQVLYTTLLFSYIPLPFLLRKNRVSPVLLYICFSHPRGTLCLLHKLAVSFRLVHDLIVPLSWKHRMIACLGQWEVEGFVLFPSKAHQWLIQEVTKEPPNNIQRTASPLFSHLRSVHESTGRKRLGKSGIPRQKSLLTKEKCKG